MKDLKNTEKLLLKTEQKTANKYSNYYAILDETARYLLESVSYKQNYTSILTHPKIKRIIRDNPGIMGDYYESGIHDDIQSSDHPLGHPLRDLHFLHKYHMDEREYRSKTQNGLIPGLPEVPVKYLNLGTNLNIKATEHTRDAPLLSFHSTYPEIEDYPGHDLADYQGSVREIHGANFTTKHIMSDILGEKDIDNVFYTGVKSLNGHPTITNFEDNSGELDISDNIVGTSGVTTHLPYRRFLGNDEGILAFTQRGTFAPPHKIKGEHVTRDFSHDSSHYFYPSTAGGLVMNKGIQSLGGVLYGSDRLKVGDIGSVVGFFPPKRDEARGTHGLTKEDLLNKHDSSAWVQYGWLQPTRR